MMRGEGGGSEARDRSEAIKDGQNDARLSENCGMMRR